MLQNSRKFLFLFTLYFLGRQNNKYQNKDGQTTKNHHNSGIDQNCTSDGGPDSHLDGSIVVALLWLLLLVVVMHGCSCFSCCCHGRLHRHRMQCHGRCHRGWLLIFIKLLKIVQEVQSLNLVFDDDGGGIFFHFLIPRHRYCCCCCCCCRCCHCLRDEASLLSSSPSLSWLILVGGCCW
jgi:hypothetical protein